MNATHPLGSIAALWRYPVKSLAGEALERVHVDAEGLAGDRRRALFVTVPEHARSGKTYRGKEDRRLHTLPDADAALALGSPKLALMLRDDGPFFDAGAVSLLLDLWLRDLERRVGLELEPLRFRANLFVKADPVCTLGEDDLVGAELQNGSVVLRVVSTIERCVTPSYDLRTGEPNTAVQRVLVRERDNCMGVYCRVERPGTLAVGERLVTTST